MTNLRIIKNKFSGASFEAPREKNKGVSLIALIITIIVILIIAGIAISMFMASDTMDRASSAKVLNEFIEVENAVSQRGTEHKLDPGVYPYEGTALTDALGRTINNKLYGDGYYYLEEDDLVRLGITGTVKNYIVNYETGEVIVTDPYMIANRTIYSKAELIDEETDNSVTGPAEYDESKGVNKPVLFSGMIPVKHDGTDWIVCSTDDEEWYDYAVTSSGPVRYANVMLLDDIVLRDNDNVYSNERVRGMNLSAMEGMTVVNQGSMFIWIPRYTYKASSGASLKNAEIVYSRLTVDYTANGFVRSPAFYNGEYRGASADNDNDGYIGIAGGRELTGIWISKYEAKYSS